MDCELCTGPLVRGRYTRGCRSCLARALAEIRVDLADEPKEVLRRAFGDDAREGAQLVKQWLSRLRQAASASPSSGG